jgi:hypothetical protein
VAGRTPQEAVHNFIRPLQRVLSCVTPAVLDWRGGYRLGATHTVVLDQGNAVRLPGADLAIRVGQSYEVVRAKPPRGPYKVSTRAYWYALEDNAGHEVIAYHWHPEQTPHRASPHLHIGQGAGVAHRDLRDAHLPTGRISVEEFIRCLIVDFHVPPRRSDWEAILTRAQQAFEEWRTWP